MYPYLCFLSCKGSLALISDMLCYQCIVSDCSTTFVINKLFWGEALRSICGVQDGRVHTNNPFQRGVAVRETLFKNTVDTVYEGKLYASEAILLYLLSHVQAVLASTAQGSVPSDATEIRGWNFDDGNDLNGIMGAMLTTGIQATALGRAINEVNRMVRLAMYVWCKNVSEDSILMCKEILSFNE